jgi:hypothetical protein
VDNLLLLVRRAVDSVEESNVEPLGSRGSLLCRKTAATIGSAPFRRNTPIVQRSNAGQIGRCSRAPCARASRSLKIAVKKQG